MPRFLITEQLVETTEGDTPSTESAAIQTGVRTVKGKTANSTRVMNGQQIERKCGTTTSMSRRRLKFTRGANEA